MWDVWGVNCQVVCGYLLMYGSGFVHLNLLYVSGSFLKVVVVFHVVVIIVSPLSLWPSLILPAVSMSWNITSLCLR
jgi:hypothetical protein